MSGINPQGCRVESFKQPSAEELSHDFLWRSTKVLPALGGISIFNRSYYEDVLIVRVHPELLGPDPRTTRRRQHRQTLENRYEDINNFERHLHRNNTRIVKVFLHLSRDEQKKRFLKRLDDPDKRWKFSTSDLAEREHWDDYQTAYEEALSATSTPWAPWYVVPADHKYAFEPSWVGSSSTRSTRWTSSPLGYPRTSRRPRSSEEGPPRRDIDRRFVASFGQISLLAVPVLVRNVCNAVTKLPSTRIERAERAVEVSLLRRPGEERSWPRDLRPSMSSSATHAAMTPTESW